MKKIIAFACLIVLVFISISYAENYVSSSDEEKIKTSVKTFVENSYNFNGIEKNLDSVCDKNFKRILHSRNVLKQKNNNRDKYVVNHVDYKFIFDKITKKDGKYLVCLHVDEFTNFNIPRAKNEVGYAGNDYEIYLEQKNGNFLVDSANINVDSDPSDAEFNINKVLGYKDIDEKEYSHDVPNGFLEDYGNNNTKYNSNIDYSKDNIKERTDKVVNHFEEISNSI